MLRMGLSLTVLSYSRSFVLYYQLTIVPFGAGTVVRATEKANLKWVLQCHREPSVRSCGSPSAIQVGAISSLHGSYAS